MEAMKLCNCWFETQFCFYCRISKIYECNP